MLPYYYPCDSAVTPSYTHVWRRSQLHPFCLHDLPVIFGACWNKWNIHVTKLFSHKQRMRVLLTYNYTMDYKAIHCNAFCDKDFGLNKFYFITQWKWIAEGKCDKLSFQLSTHMHGYSHDILPEKKWKRDFAICTWWKKYTLTVIGLTVFHCFQLIKIQVLFAYLLL